ncbi:hypothetical protein PPN31114_02352 [Pandoraea pneumonica]|uniref:Cysteine-rich CWC family protein n=1 Tax=Pandoraea pneumonica TaxID=2508299 RepID=A0A5E4V2S5_9BURK|nr:hypothetical protein [Pandoraea pneumonica]VVE05425.1 hypothetical protein PPN31114_02352 [Pandoraea pneumonica]
MDGEVKKPAGGSATRCPQCGGEVSCGAQGMVAGAAEAADAAGVTCWCLDWPHLPASARVGVGACLCPACLRAALLAAGVALKGTPADLP